MGRRRRRAWAGTVLAAAAAALTGACGGDDHPRPALHRPATPVWCPSLVAPMHVRKLSDVHPGHWDAREIIGLDLDDARRTADRHGCVVRMVGGQDADPHEVLTMDLRFNRINVDVTDGVVTALDGGGGGDLVG